MRLKCRLHLEMFAVPIYATCRRLGVPNIAHLMSCGAAKKATDTRCHLPYMFRCNAIALDRIRVSQSRAIDPSWAQVLTFLQIMASAAVSSFTPALSENTAVRWNTVKADGLLRVLNIQVMPSSRYLGSKGELIRSLDSPLPILYRYLYYSKLFSENNSQNSKNSTVKFG